MSPADGAAVYCGAIQSGETREEIHATVDGLYARPQRRTTVKVSPWTSVERWRDVADPTLIATEAELVTVLLRVPQAVRVGLLDGWRHVLRLRTEARAGVRELVLGPSDWTVIDLTAGGPS